jgi:hypothetical protein
MSTHLIRYGYSLTASWNMKALVLICCVMSLAACSQQLTSQGKTTVTELTQDLKTRCVGRYLIDLPANVKARGRAKIYGVMIEAELKTEEEFKRDMAARKKTLEAVKNRHGYQYLYDYGMLDQDPHMQYSITLRTPTDTSDWAFLIQAYKWDRGYQISLKIEARKTINSEYSKRHPDYKPTPINTIPANSMQVIDLLRKVQGRADDVIPTEPGTCFYGAFLPGKAISENEEISSSFALPDKPDLLFKVETFAYMRPERTLLERVHDSDAQKILKKTHSRLIRSGSIELPSGMKADEALASGLMKDDPPMQGQRFSLEANYTSGASTPFLMLDMDNGNASFLIPYDQVTQASLTEGEAVALWDVISRTLRPRPNAF